jgi:hypothetical protein
MLSAVAGPTLIKVIGTLTVVPPVASAGGLMVTVTSALVPPEATVVVPVAVLGPTTGVGSAEVVATVVVTATAPVAGTV